MLKHSLVLGTALAVLFPAAAQAQTIPYNNLESVCEGRVINSNICVKSVDDNEFRYLTVNSDQGLVTIGVSIISERPLMSIKLEGEEDLRFVLLDKEGDLYYESEQGTYDAFNRYYSNEFVYLFDSY
ncbi:hypothetical protein [Nodosilinea sp. FACHB-13]|uniref:hypothetical protein n=1 Tax=Cyanophyceae TaxID=3028117 RepID=UPI001685278F|nr:hypothetical protein [Nodosilinea sp. FACHB-13]MBD2107451.1 hypothetical protein [Nodosilinea sp. FACHB-13]